MLVRDTKTGRFAKYKRTLDQIRSEAFNQGYKVGYEIGFIVGGELREEGDFGRGLVCGAIMGAAIGVLLFAGFLCM